ncbi:MAG: hypothetical protein R3A46_04690 [Thermomicrobiales bacterium]
MKAEAAEHRNALVEVIVETDEELLDAALGRRRAYSGRSQGGVAQSQ